MAASSPTRCGLRRPESCRWDTISVTCLPRTSAHEPMRSTSPRRLPRLSEVELTLLVRYAVQADGLKGRVVTEDEWRDDVAVIHKPAAGVQPARARPVIRFVGACRHYLSRFNCLSCPRRLFQRSRVRGLPRHQRPLGAGRPENPGLLANRGEEISSEFGIPLDELIAVPLGVEAESFAKREPAAPDVARELKLPRRYFFSLATDYPHKNLQGLLDAYALFRSRWAGNDAAGTRARGLFARQPRTALRRRGIRPGRQRHQVCGTSLARGITRPLPPRNGAVSTPRSTKVSACHPWKRWPRAHRSSPCPSRQSPKSGATPSSTPRDSLPPTWRTPWNGSPPANRSAPTCAIEA